LVREVALYITRILYTEEIEQIERVRSAQTLTQLRNFRSSVALLARARVFLGLIGLFLFLESLGRVCDLLFQCAIGFDDTFERGSFEYRRDVGAFPARAAVLALRLAAVCSSAVRTIRWNSPSASPSTESLRCTF
jgi:hypothetical protein